MRTYAYKGKGVEKSVIRFVRTKWMTPNKCSGMLFAHWSGQVRNVVVFFHHNYDYLSYAIIRIYTILNIYFQVSETEWLAELH